MRPLGADADIYFSMLEPEATGPVFSDLTIMRNTTYIFFEVSWRTDGHA